MLRLLVHVFGCHRWPHERCLVCFERATRHIAPGELLINRGRFPSRREWRSGAGSLYGTPGRMWWWSGWREPRRAA